MYDVCPGPGPLVDLAKLGLPVSGRSESFKSSSDVRLITGREGGDDDSQRGAGDGFKGTRDSLARPGPLQGGT